MSCPTLSDVDYITPASPVMLSSHLILCHSLLPPIFPSIRVFSDVTSLHQVSEVFLTLCLCFQYFHNNLLLFNKESALDPVPDTFSTHGTTIGSTDVFLCFRQPHENFRSHSMNASKLAWAHTTCGFWCFPNLLGIKVNNSITRGSGQPGFVRGCIAEQPTTVC
ncbi:hypothetical protein FD755_001743 [Muntiacus reevesi]|uniref:Uncharacterized protein n=1 Tax=Muntiacus reevesi TaxID=9886 RepID=A0A5J5N228_MUNRE|nr:hypothetical protein FD755_001743 [Muntiacus reevesi]